MRQPRKSFNRPGIGIRHKWWQDRRCAKHGHQPNPVVAQRQISGALWPICRRCGYAIEPGGDA